ncbi:MAG: branched-chain amino acid ABC transporter permease [Solirubrobacterales bacterium]
MLDFLLGVGVLASLYGIVAIALNLQAGTTGLLNFGIVAFFGIGAYATGIGSMHGLAWPLSMLIGMLLAALAGLGFGRLGSQLSDVYWAIATLALAELLRLVALNSGGLTRGANGISSAEPFFSGLGSTGTDLAWLALSGAVLAACALIAWQAIRFQFGRTLRMVRECEPLAAALNHDVTGAKVRVLVLSAPMAALAGSLYAHYISFIGPQELAPFVTFLIWTMVVVGGMGSIAGVIVGAFLVELLYGLTRYIHDITGISATSSAGLRVLVVGACLLGFLLFRPAGIIPERLRRIDASS